MNDKTFQFIQLAEKYALAQKLGTTKGFFMYYFDQLPNFNTATDCFNAINQLHEDIFMQARYSDYDSFRKSLTHHLKVNK